MGAACQGDGAGGREAGTGAGVSDPLVAASAGTGGALVPSISAGGET